MGGEGGNDGEVSRFKWECGERLEICEKVFSGKRSNKVAQAGVMFGVGVLGVGRRNGIKGGHICIRDLITGESGSEGGRDVE